MLALVTISLVITKNVYAESYTTNNTIISSNYHDFFKTHFRGTKYKYFPYDCNKQSSYYRTCYFGIDSEGNYLKIAYNDSNDLEVTKGIDHNFILNGVNYFEVDEYSYLTLYLKTFLFWFCVCCLARWFIQVVG